MTSGFDVPGQRPTREGVVDPAVAPVGYPDETRPIPPGPSAYAPSSPGAAPGGSPLASSQGSQPGPTAEVARQQAGEVADTVKEASGQVVESVKEQAGEVTREAGRQARELIDQLRTEVSDQAATQQQRAAGGLRSLADELSGMAGRSEQDGPATDLARQVAGKLHDVAQWLEDREPGSVLDEVRSFARRRPGVYLAIAAGAGVLAGRLTRGLTSHDDTDSTGSTGSAGLPRTGAGPRPVDRPLVEPALGLGAALSTDPLAPGSAGVSEPPPVTTVPGVPVDPTRPGQPWPSRTTGGVGDIRR
jgi:hypothetical protein